MRERGAPCGFRRHTRPGRLALLALSVLLTGCETAPEIPEAIAAGGDGDVVPAGTLPFVHVAEPFESEAFRERFRMHGANRQVSIVPDPDAARSGNVLRVEIPAGKHLGANFSWRFRDHPPGEPERLYARYYLYFEPGWDSGKGGKLPGPAGRYHRAGWGGRPADGTNGWSARMKFENAFSDTATQIGWYVYDLDTRYSYGRGIPWIKPSRLFGFDSVGELEHGRWYCVESFVHLNDPERRNGRLTGWVDGKLATDSKGLRFRTVPDLRIEEYWINVYFGGTRPSPKSIVLYLDDLLLADTRLGCDASRDP